MKIEINNLSMTYPTGQKALTGIDLDLESPCLVGLVGPNGAGKSTLMKILTTRLQQTAGSVWVDGLPLAQNETSVKRRLGYLPQDFGLYDELNVSQFLEYMSILKGIDRPAGAIEIAIQQAGLSEKKRARIGSLSGGQRQRVGIAQALLGRPELMILDEPTVGLDPEERVNFRNLFSRSAADKIVILSTHIIEDVQSICNRLIVIHRGAICFNGEPIELIRQAQGHVGVYERKGFEEVPGNAKWKITSRIFTASGIQYRLVAEELPEGVRPVEPSLEDAYMYLMAKED
jgi:ABC-type multidrug transport system ATPase subunit